MDAQDGKQRPEWSLASSGTSGAYFLQIAVALEEEIAAQELIICRPLESDHPSHEASTKGGLHSLR